MLLLLAFVHEKICMVMKILTNMKKKDSKVFSYFTLSMNFAFRIENGAEEKKKRTRKSTPQKFTGPHKCLHCEKEFENRRALKRHEKNHTQEKTFPCTVCLKMFKTKAQREEHVASHETDSEFKCDQCPYIAKRIKYLRYHMKKHRKEYSAFCEPCQEGFFSRDKLETHNIAKHGAQPYQCEICRKLFLSKYSLFTHNKKHLPIEERLHYQCELCGKSFNNKQTFRLVFTQIIKLTTFSI